MDPRVKAKLKKELARIVAGKAAVRFMVGMADPDPVLLTSLRKLELSSFGMAVKMAYIMTIPTPAVVVVGQVGLDEGLYKFEMGPGGRGVITIDKLRIALRALGTEAGVSALTRCTVELLVDADDDDEAPAEELVAARRLLCGGSEEKLAALAGALGGQPALQKVLRDVGGAAVLAPFVVGLCEGDPKRVRELLARFPPARIKILARSWAGAIV
ncbi:MAG: hypothetical protein V4850_03035 [Myxococcota bacterium]